MPDQATTDLPIASSYLQASQGSSGPFEKATLPSPVRATVGPASPATSRSGAEGGTASTATSPARGTSASSRQRWRQAHSHISAMP